MRCLCENVLSCHLHVHFSVRMLHFSEKFPPKSICGLLEAVVVYWKPSVAEGPRGTGGGIPPYEPLQFLFRREVQASASPNALPLQPLATKFPFPL